MNSIGNVLKIFAVVGVLVLVVLYILLVAGVVAGAEFQNSIMKAIEIIGSITVASIAIVFVTSVGTKK
jgi:hypothetical protein